MASADATAARGPGLADLANTAVDQLEGEIEGAEAAYAAMPSALTGWAEARYALRATLVAALDRTGPKRFLAATSGPLTARRQTALARLQTLVAIEHTLQAPRATGAAVEPTSPVAANPVAVDPVTVPVPAAPAAAGRAHVAVGSITSPIASATPAQLSAARYLYVHSGQIWNEVEPYLADVGWAGVDPRFAWVSEHRFVAALLAAFRYRLEDFDPHTLAEVLFPRDPFALVDALRGGGSTWIPSLGPALARMFQEAIAASLRRLIPRYVRASDALRGDREVAEADLVLSAPMDAFVVRALARDGVASTTLVARGAGPAVTVPQLREVGLRWMGEADPALWNWVRADRHDATAEEVAASLYDYAAPHLHGASPSQFAYAIRAAPPLFALPVTWARQFPEAREHAPADALAAYSGGGQPPSPSAVSAVEMAAIVSSDLADELALGQAEGQPTPTLSAPVLGEKFVSCGLQLDAVAALLRPWGLDSRLLPTMAFDARQSSTAVGMSEPERAAWSRVVVIQGARLYEIASGLAGMPSQRARTEPSDPVFEIAETFAAAATTSHLAQTSRSLLDAAYEARAGLTLTTLQTNLTVMQAEQDSMRSISGGDRAARDQGGLYGETLDAGRHLVTALVNGEAVDPDALERVELDAQQLTLLAEVHRLEGQLEAVTVSAHALRTGLAARVAAAMDDGFQSLESGSTLLRHLVGGVRDNLEAAGLSVETGERRSRVPVPAQRAALAHAQTAMRELQASAQLDTYFKRAHDELEDQRTRTAILSLGATLALAFASAGIASVVAKAAGAMLTVEGIEDAVLVARNARIVAGTARAVKTAVDVTINSVGQSAITGESLGDAFLTNFLFTGAMETVGASILGDVATTRAVAAAFDRQVAQMASLEARVASNSVHAAALAGVKWTAHETFAITGHTLMAMAVGNAIAMARGMGPQSAGWNDLLMQCVGTAIGRHVGAALHERSQGLERLAAATHSSKARRVADQAAEMLRLAKVVERGGDARQALDLMDQRVRLLEAELAVLSDPATFLRNPAAAPTAGELAAMKHELHAQIGAAKTDGMFEVTLRLHGLEALTPDTWRGSADEIRGSIRDARSVGHVIEEAWDEQRGLTTIKIDGRAIHVYERHNSVQVERAAKAGNLAAAHELSTSVGMVAGSEMRHAHAGTAAELTRAVEAAMPRLAAVVGVSSIESESGLNYLVTLPGGAQTSVEIVFARIEAGDAARIVANSSRTARSSRGGTVEGQHVIQLSTGLAPADVERAVAHAFARVIVIHERAMMGDHPDGAGPVLTAQETGRLAEVRVLSRQLAEHPQRAAELQREILALAEHLGVTRSGADGASALERLKPNLDAAAVEALVAAAHAKPRERAQVERAIVDDQQKDLERAARRTISRPAAYDLAGPGRRANEAQLQAFADVAARHRALVSERTLADLRTRSAKVPAGKYLRIMDAIQIGGGASLAGREPSTLLIDARGRWQADANETIAQTAQQLMELAKAEFGDVRQVARPNERVSVAALRFWEDTIATRGPVVDGIASPRMDRDGRMLLEIQPSDGSAMLIVEVGGTETFATGFTPEFVPGAARQSMADSVWELEQGLKAVQNGQASSPELQDAAAIALAKLQRVERPRRGDAAIIEHALAGPHGAELRAHLSQKALLAVDATTTWNELEAATASAPQVALGDDANLTARTARMFPADPGAWHPRHVIMAGIGGTAISAAEVILAHPDTRITMYGRETPAGLLENDQFKTLARNFGTPETLAALGFESHTPAIRPALTIVQIDRYLVAPVVTVEADGRRAFKAFEGAAATGDAYVAAIGRGEQLPPEIADLVLAARRAKQVVVFKAKLDHDGQYVGYTVALGPEQARKIVLVTGAASRGAPMAEFSLSDQALIKAASARDAHAKSGNFDGGFVSSAVQTKKGAAANAAQ